MIGKFVSEKWKVFWQLCVVLVFIGLIASVFGLSAGYALMIFPIFVLGAGYYFKGQYENGLK